MEKKQKNKGIFTAYQFTDLPAAWVQKQMSVVGLRLYKELRGEPTLALDEVAIKKAIATTRSFDHPVYDFRNMFERVSTYASRCAQKLRTQHSYCNLMHVFIRTSLFNENDRYRNSITVGLPYPSNSSMTLASTAKKALEKIFEPGHAYKKAGVIVMGLSDDIVCQRNLFENEDPKQNNLMRAMDRVNFQMGSNKVKIASESLDRTFKMRQEKLSQRYSTRLDEVIEVRC